MRLKIGTFASSGASFFNGIVNWLIGADGGKMFASQNGTTFGEIQQTAFGTSDVNNVLYAPDLSSPGNNTFLASGNNGRLAKSTNGLTWSTINTGDANNIAVVQYGGEGSAPSGLSWTTTGNILPTRTQVFSGIAYGNGIWIASVFRNTTYGAGASRTSTNGTTWTSVAITTAQFSSLNIAYANGRWIAPGLNRIDTSTNGTTWSQAATVALRHSPILPDLAFGNGLWIVVGNTLPRGPIMYSSTNGTTWTTVTSHNFPAGRGIASIGYGNGIWMAGNDSGQMNTSTNGSTWTTVLSSNNYFQQIVYGDGRWIASAQGLMLTSTNGTTWTTVTGRFVNSLRRVAYGNGRWIGVEGYGFPVTSTCMSTDGMAWSRVGTVFLGGEAISGSPPFDEPSQALADTSIDVNIYFSFGQDRWVGAFHKTAAISNNLNNTNFTSYFVGVQ